MGVKEPYFAWLEGPGVVVFLVTERWFRMGTKYKGQKALGAFLVYLNLP